MSPRQFCARLGAACVVIAVLSACGSMRALERTPAAAPATNPPPAAIEDSVPPQPAGIEPAESSMDNRPEAAAPPPSCTCADVKLKQKVKAKPKPVRKAAPQQLPTAPIVAETPQGGVVDAQVRPMSVSVMSILGKRVQGPRGEDLGRVVDVLADASGRVRIAIIDFGGFLGVGNHRIAVDWPLLRFNPDAQESSLLLSLTRDRLQAAPEYKDNPRPQTLMEPPAPAVSAPAVSAPAAAPAAEIKK